GPTQSRMHRLVTELGLETFPVYNDGRLALELSGRQSLMGARKDAVPKLGPLALADLAHGTAAFNRLGASIDLARPWLSQDAAALDGQTFRTWIDRTLHTKEGRGYFEIFCEAVLAAEPSDVSLLHVLFYARSGDNLETLLAVDHGAQQDRIVGGSVLVSERLAAGLAGSVRLGDAVASIRQDESGVVVGTRSGREFAAEQVIVALPPTLAGRLNYEPILPSWRDQLTQRVPAGSVFKLHLVYERPFWRDAGLSGQSASSDGPVSSTFDNTPPGYARGVMLGLVEGAHARAWAHYTAPERRQAFVDQLVRTFGAQAERPLEYLEKDWMAEEFSRGCYGAHFAPGVWTAYGPALTEPIGRIHWAGTECSPIWTGYMEGAVRSGEECARSLLAGAGSVTS
ncbi:MAG: FAD-dependent oxidoreductase, partial [Microterricola sp.]